MACMIQLHWFALDTACRIYKGAFNKLIREALTALCSRYKIANQIIGIDITAKVSQFEGSK